MMAKVDMLSPSFGSRIEKVIVVATSKKSSASKRKTAKSKAAGSSIKDAVIIEDGAKDNAAAAKDAATAAADTKTPVAPKEAKPTPEVKPAAKATPAATAAKPADDKTVKPDAPAKPAAAAKPDATTKPDAPKAEKMPEPAVSKPAPVAPTPAPEKSRSIFLPLVLGGVVAAGIGYFASEYDFFKTGGDDATAQLRSDLEAQQERLAVLEAVEPPAPVEIPEVDLAPLETQLGELDVRLKALEDRPAIVAPEGVDVDAVAASAAAAYAAELEGLRGSVESQRAEIQALLDNAKSVEEATADAAKAAGVQAAVAKIVSALDAGQPFPDALAELKALDAGEIDPALDAVAVDGAATLSFLQAEFPAQARAALATARASGAGDEQQGLGSFLKRSLGARSVTPQEGDDPDAVLSRAEAAIKSGDLDATLTELDTLPEDAQAAIADWRAAADARVSARAAADALAQRLTAD